MRTINPTGRFRRDLKRELKGRHRQFILEEMDGLIALLASDAQLPVHNWDHALTGDWRDCRDCHIKPYLVLIYRKPDADSLELLRIGSHSELAL